MLKSTNKTNIRTNNDFIYMNISFILINISLIYTFCLGVGIFALGMSEFLSEELVAMWSMPFALRFFTQMAKSLNVTLG